MLVYRSEGLSAESPWLKQSVLAANLGLSRLHVLCWFAAHTKHSDSFSGAGNCRVLLFSVKSTLTLSSTARPETAPQPQIIHCWHQIATSANGQVACVPLVLGIKYLQVYVHGNPLLAIELWACRDHFPSQEPVTGRHLSPSKHSCLIGRKP